MPFVAAGSRVGAGMRVAAGSRVATGMRVAAGANDVAVAFNTILGNLVPEARELGARAICSIPPP
jgi:hypothetical protein